MKRLRRVANARTRPAPADADRSVGLRLANHITLVSAAKPVKPAKKPRA